MSTDTIDPREQAAREMEQKKKISEYLAETLRGEARIDTRMDPQCEVSVVIPAYAERDGILRPLLSLARQEGVKPEQFEVIVVVNNPPSEPVRLPEETQKDWERKRDLYLMATWQNEQTFLLIRSIADRSVQIELTEQEQKELEEIRARRLRVFGVDKATDGMTLPFNIANVGGARNRGVAESAERFFEEKGTNGIIAQSDADVRFPSDYIASLIRVFKQDPNLVGIAGKMYFEKTAEMETLLASSSSFSQLLMHYRWVTERLKYGRADRPSKRVVFSGGNMASRAYEAAVVGGVPKIAGGEDPAFGFRLAEIGKVSDSDTVLTYPLDRFSARTAVTAGHGQGRLKLRDMIEAGEMLVENPDAVKAIGSITRSLNQLRDNGTATIENVRSILTVGSQILLPETDIEMVSHILNARTDETKIMNTFPHVLRIRTSVENRLADVFPNISLDVAVERILVETTMDDVIREKYEEQLRQLLQKEEEAIRVREQFIRSLANLLMKTTEKKMIVENNDRFVDFLVAHSEELGADAKRVAEQRTTESFTLLREIFAFDLNEELAIRAVKEAFPKLFDTPENDPIRWTQMKLSALSRALE